MADYAPSTYANISLMHYRALLGDAHPQVLIGDYLEAFSCLDAAKDHVLIDSFRDGYIAIGFVIRIKAVWVDCFPKGFVVKRVEPLLQVLSVFELLHVSSLPQFVFGQEAKSTDRSTVIAQRSERPQSSCLNGAVEFVRSSKCLLR